MRIATWNVNSLRVRLPQVLGWLDSHQPDVLALQETKLPDAVFPAAEFAARGFQAVYSGQNTYNGVALLCRAITPIDIVTELPNFPDPQRRVLGATVGGFRILNLYVPNGMAVGSDKYAYKLDWLARLAEYLPSELGRHDRLIILGDFNIAPDERDVHDPAEWAGQVLFSEPERQALQRLLALGLVDTFRLFEQQPNTFSWWDYRAVAFRRNRGLRIDLILASAALGPSCLRCYIDKEPRRAERPSDHAPVVAEFA